MPSQNHMSSITHITSQFIQLLIPSSNLQGTELETAPRLRNGGDKLISSVLSQGYKAKYLSEKNVNMKSLAEN